VGYLRPGNFVDRNALLYRLACQTEAVEVFQGASMHDGRSDLFDWTRLKIHGPHVNSAPGQLQCCDQAARASAYDKNIHFCVR
jgi:hypothetical protein